MKSYPSIPRVIENVHEILDNYDQPASVDTRYQRISEDILREDHKQL
jgi:hypothetical protein